MGHIKPSTEIPPYKNSFDPQQFEMEAHLARFIQNNTTADELVAKEIGRAILKTVLGEFRPDMFEHKPAPDDYVCALCGSDDVESLDWVNVQTKQATETFEGGSAYSTEYNWCNGCEEHPHLVQRKDFGRTK